jgi:hypothetical protein
VRRILVIDSTLAGEARPLKHGMYSIVYVPSWLRLRYKFRWKTTMDVFKTLDIMKEYFTAAKIVERPYRAQRCLYSIKTLHIYGVDKLGSPRFAAVAREMLSKQASDLTEYLDVNPVAAWDWVVSWTECRAMAEAFPDEFRSMFRRLRSLYDTKRKQKPELLYFLDIMKTVAKDHMIDLEKK